MNPDTLHHAHEKKGDDHEGASVADEGHGQTNNRQHAQVHARVLKGMREEHGHNTDDDESPDLIP